VNASRLALSLLLLSGCTEPKRPPPPKGPAPLPALEPAAGASDGGADAERDALYRVVPAEVFGEKVPARAPRLELKGTAALLDGQPVDAARLSALEGELLLVTDDDTYLAQVAPHLAALARSKAEVALLHPQGAVAFPLVLRDEKGFQAWLDEPKPGKVRIIQRADGFELQTNVGKLPGADPNGPTVPVRSGVQDLTTLRRGLSRLKERFTSSPDLCIAPSFGMELKKTAEALIGNYRAPGEPIFEEICLVYPSGKKD
jgi:hypothetical protein